MESSFSQVSKTLRTVSKQLKSQAQEFLSNDTPLERQLKEATSNENWGCPTTVLHDIARVAYSYNNLELIMRHIWETLATKSKYWRRIYKGLNLLEYLILHGPDRTVEEVRDNLFRVKTLTSFRHLEDQRERGSGVADKAKYLVELVIDPNLLHKEREKARVNRNRFIGIGCGSTRHIGSISSLSGNDRYLTTTSISSSSGLSDSRLGSPAYSSRQSDHRIVSANASNTSISDIIISRHQPAGRSSYSNDCGPSSLTTSSSPWESPGRNSSTTNAVDLRTKQRFENITVMDVQSKKRDLAKTSLMPRTQPASLDDFMTQKDSELLEEDLVDCWKLPPPPKPINSIPLGSRKITATTTLPSSNLLGVPSTDLLGVPSKVSTNDTTITTATMPCNNTPALLEELYNPSNDTSNEKFVVFCEDSCQSFPSLQSNIITTSSSSSSSSSAKLKGAGDIWPIML